MKKPYDGTITFRFEDEESASYNKEDVYKRQVIIHYPRIKQLQTSPLSYPVDIENQMKTAICMANPTKLQETFRDFQSYFRKGH